MPDVASQRLTSATHWRTIYRRGLKVTIKTGKLGSERVQQLTRTFSMTYEATDFVESWIKKSQEAGYTTQGVSVPRTPEPAREITVLHFTATERKCVECGERTSDVHVLSDLGGFYICGSCEAGLSLRQLVQCALDTLTLGDLRRYAMKLGVKGVARLQRPAIYQLLPVGDTAPRKAPPASRPLPDDPFTIPE